MIIPEQLLLALSTTGAFSIACIIVAVAPQLLYKVRHGSWKPSVQELEHKHQVSLLEERIRHLEIRLKTDKERNDRLDEHLQETLNKLIQYAGSA